MKYRTDFVTNSSSSSYIIAIKNDITEEKLRSLITKEFVIDQLYLDENNNEAEKYIDKVVKFVVNKKYGYNKPIMLDNWIVFNYVDSYSEEENNTTFQILSGIGIKNNEFIKSKSTEC